MEANILILPGDGIGPEVTKSAVAVLDTIAKNHGHKFNKTEELVGGIAMDTVGKSLPDETLKACHAADAILFGAVGGYKWNDPDAAERPAYGLLQIRKHMELYANLRPVKIHPDLADASPLKAEKLDGVDLLVIRELTGGIYFGETERWFDENGQEWGRNTMVYSENEIRRILDFAFKAAMGRRQRLASIDKENVLNVMRIWRKVAVQMAEDYPDVETEHLLVDAATMHLLNRPASFDVMVAGNMFGDIISDEASMLSGSLGNLPSASIGANNNRFGLPQGVYEPIHGSAPDIAGQGIANPIGAILSAAMLLRHSLGLEAEAQEIETAVDKAISAGYRTADLARNNEKSVGTKTMTDAILSQLTD